MRRGARARATTGIQNEGCNNMRRIERTLRSTAVARDTVRPDYQSVLGSACTRPGATRSDPQPPLDPRHPMRPSVLDACQGARVRERASHRVAFTLLEVLVVLTLLAITAAAAVPAFLADREQGAERAAATALAMALARVRDGARGAAAPATLVLAPSEGRMWLVWRDSTLTEQLPLPPGIELAAVGGDRIQCRFEPTGTATPFEITIRGRASVPVRVDAWTGEITIGDGAPL